MVTSHTQLIGNIAPTVSQWWVSIEWIPNIEKMSSQVNPCICSEATSMNVSETICINKLKNNLV